MGRWGRLLWLMLWSIAVIGGTILGAAILFLVSVILARDVGMLAALLWAVVLLGSVVGFLDWRNEQKYP